MCQSELPSCWFSKVTGVGGSVTTPGELALDPGGFPGVLLSVVEDGFLECDVHPSASKAPSPHAAHAVLKPMHPPPAASQPRVGRAWNRDRPRPPGTYGRLSVQELSPPILACKKAKWGDGVAFTPGVVGM